MHTLGVNEEVFDAMTMAKAFFVCRAIKSVCVKEGNQGVDIFSMGYGTTEALQQQRKDVSLVCTNEKMIELEALCHSTVNEDVELRRWEGLDIKHEGNVPTPHKEHGKTLEEKEVVEPLDESVDALLHHLVNIG